MKFNAAIIFTLTIFSIASWSATTPDKDFVNMLGQKVKDSKSHSRLTVVCQRKNALKPGKLHDDLYVMYQRNQSLGNGEQILSKAGREDLYNMDFAAKQISVTRDGISVEDDFDNVNVANKLNKILDEKSAPSSPVKAQLNGSGHMKVFLKDNPKDDRFILRTYAPEITDLRDRMNKKTFYKCKIFVLPELKNSKTTSMSESCEVSKDDPTCIPLDVESRQ